MYNLTEENPNSHYTYARGVLAYYDYTRYLVQMINSIMYRRRLNPNYITTFQINGVDVNDVIDVNDVNLIGYVRL